MFPNFKTGRGIWWEFKPFARKVSCAQVAKTSTMVAKLRAKLGRNLEWLGIIAFQREVGFMRRCVLRSNVLVDGIKSVFEAEDKFLSRECVLQRFWGRMGGTFQWVLIRERLVWSEVLIRLQRGGSTRRIRTVTKKPIWPRTLPVVSVLLKMTCHASSGQFCGSYFGMGNHPFEYGAWYDDFFGTSKPPWLVRERKRSASKKSVFTFVVGFQAFDSKQKVEVQCRCPAEPRFRMEVKIHLWSVCVCVGGRKR